MRRLSVHVLIGGMLLAAGGALAGTFDRGLIAKETPASTTSSGQQLTGHVSVVIDGYDESTGAASAYEAVVSLRKGSAVHAFLQDYDCAVADPCGLCVLNGLLDTSDQVGIQLCIEDGIEPSVIQEFALAPTVAVRLKDVTNHVSELEGPSRAVFVGDVTVTVK